VESEKILKIDPGLLLVIKLDCVSKKNVHHVLTSDGRIPITIGI